MRQQVRCLCDLAPLPGSIDITEAELVRFVALLEQVPKPISNKEAAALICLLPADDDDRFETVWKLVHLIETAPGWPLRDYLQNTDNYWVNLLRQRAQNAGLL
jgi:hypothetical protein